IQSVGSAGAQPVALEAQPPPGATSQSSTIGQIQIGCLSNCFGTTTADPSTAALTQLVLAQLSSLVPPSDSSPSPPSLTGTEQSVTEQFICQVQDGSAATGQDSRPAAAQSQTALQTNATVQVVLSSLPSALEPSPGPEAVDETQQQTWQLQIGCLFYCVDSQQVQQAEQTTTTLQLVAGPPGGTAVAVAQQTIWQLQIGCLAWCWNSTQLQAASSQSGIPVPPGPAPAQASGPGPASPVTASASQPAASAGPVNNVGASAPEPPAAPTRAVVLLDAPRRVGLSILGGSQTISRSPQGPGFAHASGSIAMSAPALPDTSAVPVVRPPATHRLPARRRPAVWHSYRPPVSFQTVVSDARTSHGGSMDAAVLVLAGLMCLIGTLILVSDRRIVHFSEQFVERRKGRCA
ncbi:MAG: hypothetical protein ACRDPA_18640, partial [Solirubrobacteraceae bacterium]